jgi:hypothetical protein
MGLVGCCCRYGHFYVSYLLAAWYWSGAGLLVAAAVNGDLPTTLILIFWPLFEPILEGFQPIGTTVRASPWSHLTAGRWLHQALYAAEIMSLPPRIQNYTLIENELYDRRMGEHGGDLQVDFRDALLYLLAIGAVFRFLALVCLAKLK